MNRVHILLCTFLAALSTSALSQSPSNFSLEREASLPLENALDQGKYMHHSSIKPFIRNAELKEVNDSIYISWQKDSAFIRPVKPNFVSLRMISNISGGSEFQPTNKSFTNLNAGADLNAGFRDKVHVYAAFLTGSSYVGTIEDSLIDHNGVVPGIGKAYGTHAPYSWQYYSGYVSYTPSKAFNLQAGRDKHFWGDGYRSLFLSDVAAPYPYFKITGTAWKIRYVSMFNSMTHVTKAGESVVDHRRKYGTFHYLSWNVSRRVNFSLFESIIWMGSDKNRVRFYDVNYLNPVIFFRPVEYSLGSSDNAFLGGAFKIKAGKKYRQQFYGQLILDEFLLKEVLAIFKKVAHFNDTTVKYGWWANKQGIQLGFKNYDLFTVKNLVFLTEINAVRPYTYTHGNTQQNYAHLHQPLAHPLGANFGETVNILNYRKRRWLGQVKFIHSIYGKDENGLNWGQDIFQSYTTHPKEYGNKFFQGLRTTRTQFGLSAGFMIIPAMNLQASVSWTMIHEQSWTMIPTKSKVLDSRYSWFMMGLKTPLFNRYDDL